LGCGSLLQHRQLVRQLADEILNKRIGSVQTEKSVAFIINKTATIHISKCLSAKWE